MRARQPGQASSRSRPEGSRAPQAGQRGTDVTHAKSANTSPSAKSAPAARAPPPATKPIRRMFVSLSSRENPSHLDRCIRTTSPSSIDTARPRSFNSTAS